MTQETASPHVRASLILPVYNHEERLTEVLDEIRSTMRDDDYEIIVVYDVTNPEMIDSVKAEQGKLKKEYGIRPVTRVNQRGFGGALRFGFEASRGQIVIPIMADCSDDIAAIPRMLDAIKSGADIVGTIRHDRDNDLAPGCLKPVPKRAAKPSLIDPGYRADGVFLLKLLLFRLD